MISINELYLWLVKSKLEPEKYSTYVASTAFPYSYTHFEITPDQLEFMLETTEGVDEFIGYYDSVGDDEGVSLYQLILGEEEP